MLKVKQIMSSPVVSVKPDTLVKDASSILAEKNITGVPVMDGGRLVGVFTEADVLRSIKTTKKELRMIYPSISSLGVAFQEEVTQREIIEAYNEVGKREVKEVMSKNPETASPDMTVNEIIVKMVQNGITMLPVVERGNVVGIVTRGDVIRGIALDQPQQQKKGS